MKTPLLRSALALFPFAAALAGCAAEPPRAAMAPAPAAQAAPIPVLARSLYAKDATGALGENDLQTVLSSPIDLAFPARVGVVPVPQAFESGKVSLSLETVAAHDLAAALRGHPNFSQVSDVSTALPNTGGIEGLRVIAARYRIRYLILYSQRFEDATHLNGWAWTYPTLIGMFVAPGGTVASRGVAEADLLDVRTGTVLFSVEEPIEVSSHQLMVGAGRTHQELQEKAAAEAAKRLAKKVTAQANALVAFAEESAKEKRAVTRVLPAPVAMQ